MYKQLTNPDGTLRLDAISRLRDSGTVPFDPANTDYTEYLKWVAEGNTPQPAEQGTT